MSDYQMGTKTESAYGTPVTVDTFWEFLPGDPIQVETGRTDSNGLRTGRYVPRADRFQPYVLGGTGSRQLEVLDTGFDWWLPHLMGASSKTSNGGVDTHTAIFGDLCGKSFTWQENILSGACKSTDNAVTFAGGKVNSWTLSCDVEGNLVLEVEVFFSSFSTATGLATASYPVGAEVLSWSTGKVKLGGSDIPVTSWELSCNNNLKTDRHYINGSGATPGAARKEPVTNGDREVTFKCDLDLTDLSHWQKSVSTVRATTLMSVETVTEGPVVITGSTYPALKVNAPNVRLDEVSIGQLQTEMSTQTISGVVVDGGGQPLTLTYITAT